eukprot:GFYU01008314.1.p1 GENE.GFYU01008314.1~~GFYU01008314.1.p1  ORF type:complete len:379 (-),score=52.78 GFYU01008314.1:329-1465(-)
MSSTKEKPDIMRDEYGEMNAGPENAEFEDFEFECGEVLPKVVVNYQTWGKLNSKKDNTMVICHALTGNAQAHNWWKDMFGTRKVFDEEKYYIICMNLLGSCYGSSGPKSIDPRTDEPYGPTFPFVSTKDNARIQRMVIESLGIKEVAVVVGGSLGGMVALEWSYFTDMVRSSVIIACGGRHSAWQIGVNEIQRQAIALDPKFKDGWYDPSDPPTKGLGLARQHAMMSYRTHYGYETKFARTYQPDVSPPTFSVVNYLHYQGKTFNTRFDTNTYISMTHTLDSHDVSRGREEMGYPHALKGIEIPVLVVGISSDVLYPVAEQKDLHKYIPNSDLCIIQSPHGHDGFLLEHEKLNAAVLKWLRGKRGRSKGFFGLFCSAS